MIRNRRKLGDILVEAGEITQSELHTALRRQRINGKRLGLLLIEEGLVTESQILSVLEIQLGIQRIHLDSVTIDETAAKSISESLVRKHTIIPIAFENSNLVVAMSDPLNIFALDDVKISSGFEVSPRICSTEEIVRAIDKFYSSSVVMKAAEELYKENALKAEDKKDTDDSLAEIKNAPVVKLIDSIIDNAVKQRCSDIHIEPFESYLKIRYRIDGELQEVLRLPTENIAALITRVKILAGMNIAEKRIPQDGRIITYADEKPVDLRVSVLPTVYGEKVVIRILRKHGFLIGREALEIPKEDMDKMDRVIQSPHGIILASGPTGSGKSTTLYTILSELNKANSNIITVEDPVEYTMEGVNQVNVNTKAGLTFAAGLRSILRQDPDIVMVGEIRDSETAEIAVRAAITGHLVLSTIHTNDAVSTVTRLIEMGIEPYLVASSLSGVIAQRLVRRICPKCKKTYEATSYEKKILKTNSTEKTTLYKGTGCKYCNNSGYYGRIGVYEIMEMSRIIREGIISQISIDELQDLCLKNGMKTLRDYCTALVLEGTTTVEELIKIAYFKD